MTGIHNKQGGLCNDSKGVTSDVIASHFPDHIFSINYTSTCGAVLRRAVPRVVFELRRVALRCERGGQLMEVRVPCSVLDYARCVHEFPGDIFHTSV